MLGIDSSSLGALHIFDARNEKGLRSRSEQQRSYFIWSGLIASLNALICK